jgi:outer membrane lipoprotein-sorting protein
MNRLLLGILVILAGDVTAGDTEILGELRSRLVIYQDVEGQFQQAKHLTFMSAPLISRGVFTATLKSGLRWRVSEPVKSIMVVNNRGVTLNGEQVRDTGVGRTMATIVSGFMNGNLQALNDEFDLEAEFTATDWQLVMRPSRLMLSQVLERIDVTGADSLSSATVIEKSGNYTVITFSGMQELDESEHAQIE